MNLKNLRSDITRITLQVDGNVVKWLRPAVDTMESLKKKRNIHQIVFNGINSCNIYCFFFQRIYTPSYVPICIFFFLSDIFASEHTNTILTDANMYFFLLFAHWYDSFFIQDTWNIIGSATEPFDFKWKNTRKWM